MPTRSKAFTIVELLVVFIIVGTLIAAAAYSFNDARKKNRNAQRLGDVMLIGQAIDQYSAANRSNYPQPYNNATCADQLSQSITPPMDLSVFPAKAIPRDPEPQITHEPTNDICSSYGARAGYTYYSRKNLQQNAAFFAQARYVLAVGLEGTKDSDESIFRAPSAFNGVIGSMYPDVLTGTPPRNQYWLTGKYCGSDTQCFSGN